MRILIIGSLGPGSLEGFYVRGLRARGWSVSTVDVQSPLFEFLGRGSLPRILYRLLPRTVLGRINREAIRRSETEKPDAILVFKGMELLPSTVRELADRTRLLANYNPDHPFRHFSRGSGNRYVTTSLRFYDLHLSYARSIVSRLSAEVGKPAVRLPFGYDEAVTPVPGDAPECAGSILFIGRADAQRAEFLSGVLTDRLAIYGNGEWPARCRNRPALRDRYRGRPLYGPEYAAATAVAVGSINILRPQNLVEESHNMRTFEVPGYGGLMFSRRTEEQQEFFEDEKEAVYYDSVEELNEKIRHYLARPRDVRRIKDAAHARCRSGGYSYFDRAGLLDGILGDALA